MFQCFGSANLGTWVDPWTLLRFWRFLVMGGYLKRWSVAALCLSSPEGYVRYGFDSNWAGLGALGTLARCTSYVDACTGAGLQWEW